MKRIALIFTVFTLLNAQETPKVTTPRVALTDQQFEEIIYNWTRSFAEILQITAQKHYKVCNLEDAMIKSCDNFLNCLDPHSNMLDPKTYKNMLDATGGEFFGIGIVIDNTRSSKDKFLTVIDTVPEGPADKAGIKQLDKIIEVNGEPLEGNSTDEITSKLKGERGTKVSIKVLRENHPDLISFEITRDLVKEHNSLCFYLEDQNIYYVSLTIFSETAAQQLETLLTKAQAQQCRGIVLDLRNNTGGLLTSAIDIVGLFLPKGSLIVTTKNKHQKVTDRYITTRAPIAPDGIPLFILINNFTASAGEILAGCLKVHANESKSKANRLVFLVGSKSFGKGSVQEVIPISNNCAIKITTSLYFLPNDTSIQGTGITPDFEIERRFAMTEQQKWFTQTYGREQALSNYITVDESQKKETKKKAEEPKTKTWDDRIKEMLETDNQLRETITLINILASAQRNCPKKVFSQKKALEYLKDIYISSSTPLKLVPVKM